MTICWTYGWMNIKEIALFDIICSIFTKVNFIKPAYPLSSKCKLNYSMYLHNLRRKRYILESNRNSQYKQYECYPLVIGIRPRSNLTRCHFTQWKRKKEKEKEKRRVIRLLFISCYTIFPQTIGQVKKGNKGCCQEECPSSLFFRCLN